MPRRQHAEHHRRMRGVGRGAVEIGAPDDRARAGQEDMLALRLDADQQRLGRRGGKGRRRERGERDGGGALAVNRLGGEHAGGVGVGDGRGDRRPLDAGHAGKPAALDEEDAGEALHLSVEVVGDEAHHGGDDDVEVDADAKAEHGEGRAQLFDEQVSERECEHGRIVQAGALMAGRG